MGCAIDLVKWGQAFRWIEQHAAGVSLDQPEGVWRIVWNQRGIVRQAEAATLAGAVQLARQEWDAIEDAEGIGGGA